jgi:hypothetical protein
MKEVVERIERLNPYESQGYQCDRLRQFKELLREFPERAKIAFELFDFSIDLWGGDLAESMQKHPLSHLQIFFYSEAASVKQWVELQICGMLSQMENHRKYIDTLKKQKDKDFWQRAVDRLGADIKKYNEALTDYMIFN